jgi:iron complex outermembrane recepter protein
MYYKRMLQTAILFCTIHSLKGQDTMPIKNKDTVFQIQEIIVVGTRSTIFRTNTQKPAPVDVFFSRELLQTGQTDINQALAYCAPSFNSNRQTLNGANDNIDPATLRGLGPDQTLVLINGKRQHATALVYTGSSIGRGTVGTDMNAIPIASIDKIEVLRDGASAQYGSDAIAGVLNLRLRSNVHSGQANLYSGQTSKGDGGIIQASVNYGFELGKNGGFFNVTGAYRYRQPTNRADAYNGPVYSNWQIAYPAAATPFQKDSVNNLNKTNKLKDDSTITAKSFNRNQQKAGNGLAIDYSGFYNMEIPISKSKKTKLYSFGGYNLRSGESYGFYRYPFNTRASVTAIFPDGYLPTLQPTTKDFSTVVGIKKETGKDITIDISGSYGSNVMEFVVNNSINASLGAKSPTKFDAGSLLYKQLITELNISKKYLDIGVTTLNLAFGAALRYDNFEIKSGEAASWTDGDTSVAFSSPTKKQVGVQFVGGFRPANVSNGNAIYTSRTNANMYIDVETDLNSKLMLAGALRYEKYSDFGSNLSGKLLSIYKLTPSIAIRAGVNRGFRAPSLQQSQYSAVTTQFLTIGGKSIQREVVTVRNNDLIVRNLGVPELKAETSTSYSTGITARVGNVFVLTVDAYRIDIKDRIVISGRFSNTVPQLASYFASTTVTDAQFFTNAIDTRTRGLDIIGSYRSRFQNINHSLTINVAANFNTTIIVGDSAGVKTTAQLAGLGETLLNREERGRIESNQPKDKFILSANYKYKNFGVLGRSTRFGEITTRDPWLNRSTQVLPFDQTFAAKWITDAAISYTFLQRMTITIGANNLFDTYPDKNTYPNLTNNGTTPYSRLATQFGFNGASYYANLNVKF